VNKAFPDDLGTRALAWHVRQSALPACISQIDSRSDTITDPNHVRLAAQAGPILELPRSQGERDEDSVDGRCRVRCRRSPQAAATNQPKTRKQPANEGTTVTVPQDPGAQANLQPRLLSSRLCPREGRFAPSETLPLERQAVRRPTSRRRTEPKPRRIPARRRACPSSVAPERRRQSYAS
jgi:hypothetical protein